MTLTVALSGDSIVNRRISACDDEGFLSLIDEIRAADIGFTHLEMNLLDEADDHAYPAAEAGGTWMSAQPRIAEEFAWAGFEMVSHASNHALDYGYGGLASTWAALENQDIDFTGTGRTLADARGPVYREASGGRVACVSMTTSFTPWSRAGRARRDHGGRPGVNPLGYHFEMGPDALDQYRSLAAAMGQWVTPTDDGYRFNPPGLHNTVFNVTASEQPGVRPVLDSTDRQGNLRAVAEADRQADITVAHVHTHEWDTDGDLSDPAPFLPAFTRDCIDAGADVVLCQGSHTPLRGIDRYGGGIVLHDPGDFFMMSDTTRRLPAEFYDRYSDGFDGHSADAAPGQVLAERGISSMFDEDADDSDADYGGAVESPAQGYFSGDVLGTLVPVCEFDDEFDLARVTIHPGYLRASPTVYTGTPTRATGDRAQRIINHVDELSARFDTDIEYSDGVGTVDL
jgi:Putative enzyme of poly-gamma-glutamate biosynthesis (capsule formation)